MDQFEQDAQKRMEKSLDVLRQALAKIRTGRASASLLDGLMVACYGSETALNQVANITVQEGRTLVISPWDMALMQDIEKALMKSDIGSNPNLTGDAIRLTLPPLTEEKRKDLTKTARQTAEQGRVAIRNVRRDVIGTLKNQTKQKEISVDDERRGQDRMQKLTDQYIKQVEHLLQGKEKDLMEIG